MKKAIIIGCPGSGKSTFARKLSARTGLPLHHLDMMYWNADKTTVSKEVFIKRLKDVLSTPSWIIDGNYGGSMELRIKECDTVFFLDYPTEVCLQGIRERVGTPRSDMPWMEFGETDAEFLEFVNRYRIDSRPQVLRLLEQYSDKSTVIFQNRAESDAFLRSV